MSPVPAVAAIVGNIGIAAIVGIKAMGHLNGLPRGDLFAVPRLPRAAERALQILPASREAMGVGGWITVTRGQSRDGGAERGARE